MARKYATEEERRQAHNACARRYARALREKDPEGCNLASRVYYHMNISKSRKRKLDYYYANKERILKRRKELNAQKRGIE